MRGKEVLSEGTAWTKALGPVSEELEGIQGTWSVDLEEEEAIGRGEGAQLLVTFQPG